MSSDSETEIDLEEFWNNNEEDESIVPDSPTFKSEAEFFKSLSLKNRLPAKFLFRELSLRTKQPLPVSQESISILRKQNKQEENMVRQEVKSKTRQELKAALQEINAEFEKEIHVIRLEHDKMKEEISRRSREIGLMGKFMVDQEVLIAQTRLNFLLDKEPPAVSQAQIAELHQLKSDLNIMKVQINGMKEATIDYSNQTFSAAAKLKELDVQIQGIKSKHRDELKVLEVELLKKVEIARIERDKIKQQFDEYKSSGWQNIGDTEESLKSQNRVIEQLKNELRTAKEILRHPKLKLRVHEKLEDYVKEYEDDQEVESPTTVGSSDKKKYTKRSTEGKPKSYRNKDLDFGSRFGSICSDSNTAYSKIHTRRSTVTDGFRARLSPL